MPRARTKVDAIKADLMVNLVVVRGAVDKSSPDVDLAMAHVETFCAIALRVISQTNPSKVRDAAMVTEMSTLLAGGTRIE